MKRYISSSFFFVKFNSSFNLLTEGKRLYSSFDSQLEYWLSIINK